MKNFLISIGKAACYIILFLASQYAVSAAYIYGSMIYYLIKNYNSLLSVDPSILTEIIQDISKQAIGDQNIIYLVSAVITVIILALFFHMRSKRLTDEVWAKPIRLTSLVPLVFMGIFFPLFICMVLQYIPWPAQAMESYDELYTVAVDNSILSFVTAVIAAPILEELTYRGLVFTRLCRGMPALAAAILTSTVFGAMHGTLIWAAYAFIGSMMLIFVYTKYRSLYASVFFHMLFNLVGGFLVAFIPSFGTSIDIIFTVICFIMTVLLVYIIWRMPRNKIDITAKN